MLMAHHLTLTATDLELEMVSHTDVMNHGVDGQVTIPARKAVRYL